MCFIAALHVISDMSLLMFVVAQLLISDMSLLMFFVAQLLISDLSLLMSVMDIIRFSFYGECRFMSGR
jgi:hypothetical protein